MNNKKILSFIILFLIVVIGILYYNDRPSSKPITPPPTSIEYTNNQYGFNFALPLSWKGYSIVIENWKGQMIDNPNASPVQGPEILIRNPLWTYLNPRQDIPIMIFTPAEWNLVQEEKLSLGAAPIGPSELGQNTKYVFALPARYNFAFLTGFGEVENILENKPLNTF